MSYFVPYIDESGFHYPSYNDILEDLVEKMQDIYGSGIYLGNDSQDYQMLSAFSEKIFDSYQTCEIAYNSHSPVTAIGTGLDYVVAVNGIMRKEARKSTVELLISGTAGTTIVNGIVSDINGNIWDLPSTVVIGDGGTVSVEAVCRETGIIQAAPGTVTRIMTPTRGWEAVTNDGEAVTGTVAEADSELRARQAESTALPSQSLTSGLVGALGAIEGVNRKAVYENDKKVTDANGIPPNSICCVVEGGSDEEIANAINLRKSGGCGTYGNESVEIILQDGQRKTIHFSRLQYVDVEIAITITPRAGYVTSVPQEIKTAIVEYLDSFSIGTDLTTSIIWMVAQQVNRDPRAPAFSISSVVAARQGDNLSIEDVVIAYNEVAKGREPLISVTVK